MMTIVVGTDTNQEVAAVDSYHSDRGNTDWAAQGTTQKEQNMRKAADWLERNFRWRGTKKTSAQRLGWPRDQAFDNDSYAIGESAAPFQVAEAEAIIADLYRGAANDLEGIVTDNDAAVIREKVDVIEVAYDSKSRLRGGDVISHVHKLLDGVTLGKQLLRS